MNGIDAVDFFVSHPIRAWIVGGLWWVVFELAVRRKRDLPTRLSLLLAALAWTAYGFWERHANALGWDIRVDLFLIYPVLLALSVMALLRAADAS